MDSGLLPFGWPRVRPAPPSSERCSVLGQYLFSKDCAKIAADEHGLPGRRLGYLFEDLDILDLTFISHPLCLAKRFSQMTLDTRRFLFGKVPKFGKQLVGTRWHESWGDYGLH